MSSITRHRTNASGRGCEDFLYIEHFQGHAFGAPGRIAWPDSGYRPRGSPAECVRSEGTAPPAGWGSRESRRYPGGQLGPLPLALPRTGAGRCRYAVTPHPPPGGSRRHAVLVTRL